MLWWELHFGNWGCFQTVWRRFLLPLYIIIYVLPICVLLKEKPFLHAFPLRLCMKIYRLLESMTVQNQMNIFSKVYRRHFIKFSHAKCTSIRCAKIFFRTRWDIARLKILIWALHENKYTHETDNPMEIRKRFIFKSPLRMFIIHGQWK